MIRSLSSAAVSMKGAMVGADDSFDGISTDTRSLDRGNIFFALQGPNFDGNDYVAAASAAGAIAAVVNRPIDADIARIEVDDTRLALGRFAKAWRRNHDVRVVGVTGSNGKTTLKEMIAACLGNVAPTLATEGNLNNDIGLPLMVARINATHEFAVLEMGANHSGEIAYLAAIANPDVVVITNAGAAHLEGFGSVEGVAKAKGEILQISDRPSAAILNADDDYFDYWQTLVADVNTVSFGLSEAADIRAVNINSYSDHSDFDLSTPRGDIFIRLPLPGIHNVRNACAAAAVALQLDVDLGVIQASLESIQPVTGRLQPMAGRDGCIVFNDSYNANPLSVISAAQFLASLDGENWLVLGDMKELGEGAKDLHREVGESARASGVDRLLAYGDLALSTATAFGPNAEHFSTMSALLEAVASAGPGVNVLVKGSRSMRMERVVDALCNAAPMSKEA